MNQVPDAIFDFRLAATELRRHMGFLAATSTIGILLALLSVWVLPRLYVATATFYPLQGGNSSSAADALKGLAGGMLPNLGALGVPSANSEIYPDLLTSQRILSSGLSTRWRDAQGKNEAFFRHFGFVRSDSSEALAEAIAWAQGALDVGVNKANGFVTLKLSSSDPDLSAAFLNAILDRLIVFNTESRQSQARSVREFLAGRIAAARTELEAAEGALSAFRSTNVRFSNSPRLVLQESRFEREVRLAESIYQSLAQQYEIARVDEARDTPAITIVDVPSPPKFPSGPSTGLRLVLGMFAGGMAGGLWAVRRAWGLIPPLQ